MESVNAEKVKELQIEGKKLLVDYWAKWCGPCKMLIPRLESIESEYPDVTFVKVDVDENVDSALELGIRSVPTVLIYDGTKLVNRFSGASDTMTYKSALDKL